MDGNSTFPATAKLRRILAIVECDDDAPIVLEKALSLARLCGARVEAVVTDAAQMRSVMKLCSSLNDDQILVSCVYRGAGPLAELVLNRMDTSTPDLIVKSPDISDPMLVAESAVPVLIARTQPWNHTTPRIAVVVEAADNAQLESSRATLAAATRLALDCRGNLDILYSEPELDDETVRMERAVKVAKLSREVNSGYGRLQMFSGAPHVRLPPLIAARNYDVLVLGARIHSAHRFADATCADIMFVRAAVHAEARMAARRPDSRRQQRAHQLQQAFRMDRLADDAQMRVGLEFADRG
ncbi:MAG: hypothetical protein H7Y89_10360 [Steroidobacteraceae bacterium]|nr:hypothetical protein [Steroidobacteraceae bacterium]